MPSNQPREVTRQYANLNTAIVLLERIALLCHEERPRHMLEYLEIRRNAQHALNALKEIAV